MPTQTEVVKKGGEGGGGIKNSIITNDPAKIVGIAVKRKPLANTKIRAKKAGG